MQPEKPNRRSVRLKDYSYSSPGMYYVTICSDDRRCIFGNIADGELQPSISGRIALKHWGEIASRWSPLQLDRFVLMPNHLHGILFFPDTDVKLPSLGTVINWYKRAVTVSIRERYESTLVVWQRNYYEHVVRDERDLERIREYVDYNPGRWEEDEYYRHET